LHEQDKPPLFESVVLPHLDAAYNLARWLLRNDHDAQDVVQEAVLRAYRFFDGFHGGDARAWLLAIVRNSCYTWLQRHRDRERITDFDEETHTCGDGPAAGDASMADPQLLWLKRAEARLVREAIAALPLEFREVVVFRDMEGFSYKEISDIARIPIGTVMSRLARARRRLQRHLRGLLNEE
jgi:RNA polymerase sigma-70 factor (ECF subfamily)